MVAVLVVIRRSRPRVARGSFLDVEYSAPLMHSQGIADEAKKEAIGLTRSRDVDL